MLVVQLVIKQWDKSQHTQAHVDARQQLPISYPIDLSKASFVADRQVVVEQYGDDVMGNRLRYQLIEENIFLIDRLRFDLQQLTVESLSQDKANTALMLKNGWAQFRYDWRYKVFEGGFYYWLYEDVTINAGFMDNLNTEIFTTSQPQIVQHIEID
jgi:hypothetical protein